MNKNLKALYKIIIKIKINQPKKLSKNLEFWIYNKINPSYLTVKREFEENLVVNVITKF